MSEKGYVLAIDQGTSSTKSIIFDSEGKVKFKASVPLETQFLNSNWVEQSPEGIYQNVLDAVKACIGGFEQEGGDKGLIRSAGISNQRETFIIWDESGEPLYNAVVWQCKRSIDICNRLEKNGLGKAIREKTGLIIDPYFSGTKVIWLYENVPAIKSAIDEGKAYFGNVDTWLLYKLTKGESYFTDHTNASRTMFFNLQDLGWDRELLDQFGLSRLNLPELKPSSADFGSTDFEGLLDEKHKIGALIGDSHAAAFGEGCFETGSAKATLGTGCSILMNIGAEYKASSSGMVSTICWSTADRVDYALEGIIVSAGSTIEWVKNQLSLFDSPDQLQSICEGLEDNGGVYIVPAFSGLGAPYWDMERKASIDGLTFSSGKEHVIRAALESVPYQIKDVVVAMEKDAGTPLTSIKIDGGITSNSFVVQFLADLLDRTVTKIDFQDLSALGAAYMAGLEGGVYQSIESLKKLNQDVSQASAGDNRAKVQGYYNGWQQAITRRNNPRDQV